MVCQGGGRWHRTLTAAERFSKAAAALKAGDAEDKSAYQDRKRVKAQEKQAMQKSRDGEELWGGVVARLGPGLGIPEQEDLGKKFDILRLSETGCLLAID